MLGESTYPTDDEMNFHGHLGPAFIPQFARYLSYQFQRGPALAYRPQGTPQVPSSFGLDEDSQGLPLETPDLIQQIITVGHFLRIPPLHQGGWQVLLLMPVHR